MRTVEALVRTVEDLLRTLEELVKTVEELVTTVEELVFGPIGREPASPQGRFYSSPIARAAGFRGLAANPAVLLLKKGSPFSLWGGGVIGGGSRSRKS